MASPPTSNRHEETIAVDFDISKAKANLDVLQQAVNALKSSIGAGAGGIPMSIPGMASVGGGASGGTIPSGAAMGSDGPSTVATPQMMPGHGGIPGVTGTQQSGAVQQPIGASGPAGAPTSGGSAPTNAPSSSTGTKSSTSLWSAAEINAFRRENQAADDDTQKLPGHGLKKTDYSKYMKGSGFSADARLLAGGVFSGHPEQAIFSGMGAMAGSALQGIAKRRADMIESLRQNGTPESSLPGMGMLAYASPIASIVSAAVGAVGEHLSAGNSLQDQNIQMRAGFARDIQSALRQGSLGSFRHGVSDASDRRGLFGRLSSDSGFAPTDNSLFLYAARTAAMDPTESMHALRAFNDVGFADRDRTIFRERQRPTPSRVDNIVGAGTALAEILGTSNMTEAVGVIKRQAEDARRGDEARRTAEHIANKNRFAPTTSMGMSDVIDLMQYGVSAESITSFRALQRKGIASEQTDARAQRSWIGTAEAANLSGKGIDELLAQIVGNTARMADRGVKIDMEEMHRIVNRGIDAGIRPERVLTGLGNLDANRMALSDRLKAPYKAFGDALVMQDAMREAQDRGGSPYEIIDSIENMSKETQLNTFRKLPGDLRKLVTTAQAGLGVREDISGLGAGAVKSYMPDSDAWNKQDPSYWYKYHMAMKAVIQQASIETDEAYGKRAKRDSVKEAMEMDFSAFKDAVVSGIADGFNLVASKMIL